MFHAIWTLKPTVLNLINMSLFNIAVYFLLMKQIRKFIASPSVQPYHHKYSVPVPIKACMSFVAKQPQVAPTRVKQRCLAKRVREHANVKLLLCFKSNFHFVDSCLI